MALYKRREFYEKCGVSKSHLSVYISRGKVILTGKMIDDSIPENAYFLQTCLDKLEANGDVKSSVKPTKKITKPSKILTSEDVEEIEELEITDDEVDKKNMYNLGIEKKKLDIEKAQEDIEIARLKREKLSGELIPTDLVKIIFATHSKSITTSFHQTVENLLSTIAKNTGLDREQVAKIRGDLIDSINKAVKDAGAISKKDLGNLVDEYSQKRGKGERE